MRSNSDCIFRQMTPSGNMVTKVIPRGTLAAANKVGLGAYVRGSARVLRHDVLARGQAARWARCALGALLPPQRGVLPGQVVCMQQWVPAGILKCIITSILINLSCFPAAK